MIRRLTDFFKNLLPLFFASQLQPFSQPAAAAGSFPNGRYMFYGRTNGASRRKKTNRLRLSTRTRNKHR